VNARRTRERTCSGPVVEYEQETPGDSLRKGTSEGIRCRADLEELARAENDAPGPEPRQQLRRVSAFAFYPFEGISGLFGLLTLQADDALQESFTFEEKRPNGKRIEEFVGDEEAGEPGDFFE
jgi:hypothetical protein